MLKMRAYISFGVFTACTFLGTAEAQTPAALGKPIIDNSKVTIWDTNLNKGESAPATPKNLDTVILYVEGAKIKTVANGKSTVETRKFGDAVFVPTGTGSFDTVVFGGPVHEVLVALKDGPQASGYPYPNLTKYALAFPRPGAVKVLDNSRVTTWHYCWVKGKPTPMHFHNTDVVLAYRYDGQINSTTPDGKVEPNHFKAGEIRFNPGNRTHFETLASDQACAVMMELK